MDQRDLPRLQRAALWDVKIRKKRGKLPFLRGPGSEREDFPSLREQIFKILHEDRDLPLVVRHGVTLPCHIPLRIKACQFSLEQSAYDFLILRLARLSDDIFPG